ncbi:receptor-type tyrosine-protein phosphatase-like N [Heptranchias perlo]|uniref:receptor-type tyrosine-protein phosphatase-like N n=1 Tax=Heptranchias perlo TaxID=212740 RepID=UPI0035599946
MKPATALRSPLPLHHLLLLVLLLLLAPSPVSSSSPRTYGCLFDEGLCSHHELCVNDGLFGHCQDSLLQARTQYDVSAAVLKRLQEVLKQLMLQGLSWQDDVTQYVISMEMEKVPKLRPHQHRLTTGASPGDRFQQHPGKAHYPAGISMSVVEQWPPSLISRYLQSILYGSHHGLHSAHNIDGSLLEPYLFRKSGNVFQLRAEQDSSHQRRADHHRVNHQQHPSDYALPSDYANSYGLIYGQTQDPNPKLQTRMKDHGADPSSPRSLEEPAARRIAMELDKYGIDLQDLSDQQLNSMSSAILQLMKTDSQPDTAPMEPDGLMRKKASMMEGTMQHWKEIESRESSESQIPDPDGLLPPNPPGASTAGGAEGEEALATIVAGSVLSKAAGDGRIQLAEEELGGAREEPSHVLLEEMDLAPERLLHTEGLQPDGIPTGAPTQRKEEYAYIVTNKKPLTLSDGIKLLESLAHRIHLATVSFINISVIGPALTFRLRHNDQNLTIAEVANKAIADKWHLEAETGLKIVQAGVGERNVFHSLPKPARHSDTFRFLLLTFIAVACIAGILIAGAVIFCLRQNAKQRHKEKLAGLGPEGGTDTSLEYQELCRQHMAAKSSYARTETVDTSRVSSVSSQFSDAPQASPSSHSSTPSWCEEPVQSNMDISTGHMILAYMEDHLKTKDRLHKEWEALCAYQAEPNARSVSQSEANVKKCRNPDFVPYDHNRMILKAEVNPSRTDFINASPIIDHDPRMPAYIATQGPLSHTISDFWQMVWENGCTVIVMLTPLVEDSVKHCDRYWPDEGSSLYHIYEVNLISEHIWCEDFLVRSFYLKNVQSQETRTLTQFHFLSWPAEGTPSSTRPLLDFRRKVNKCYRGRSCPIIVHCSDGAGRTGTYTLIDMVLNRMSKGVKEIDIAATLEHIRDQRPGMVCTKDQFEFALTAVAGEVNAILKALPQ